VVGADGVLNTNPANKEETTTDTQIKANITVYARYTPADLGITGDAEASLPLLIQAVEKEVTPQRRSARLCAPKPPRRA